MGWGMGGRFRLKTGVDGMGQWAGLKTWADGMGGPNGRTELIDVNAWCRRAIGTAAHRCFQSDHAVVSGAHGRSPVKRRPGAR